MSGQFIRVPALEVQQNDKRKFYSFAIDGKQLTNFAAVSRIRRGATQEIEGYQRPEVISHIAEIRNYLESSAPLVPNAIIVAFDGRVRFESSTWADSEVQYIRTGVLHIPVDSSWSEQDKPGWIVDGQQRTAAIREASIASFPIAITAFIAEDLEEQRRQFILVNSTKPLPKSLIFELLPMTSGRLPSALQKRRFPAYLLERLNRDEDSPFKQMIATPTTTSGIVKDNSVLRMLESSLTDGILYRYRDPDNGEGDAEQMLSVLKDYWHSVVDVFPEAWGLPPKRSRLMHGAGIMSLGHLMDAIGDRFGPARAPNREEFREEVVLLRDTCRWTHGYWDFGPGKQRKWNEVQNTSKDIQMLASFLLFKYRECVSVSRQSAH